MTELTPSDKKLLESIESHGWHVLKIMEGDDSPPFAYSVGLYNTFQHPEIVIVGLKHDLAHLLINNIGEGIRSGTKFESGQFYKNILDGFECLMLKVNREFYDAYFGYGKWYYKNSDFPVLQCIYPTIKGAFPWEKEWPEDIRDLQPVLGVLPERIEKQ